MAARPVQRDQMTKAQQKTQKPAARATASALLLLFVALRSLSSSQLTSALAMLSVAISVGFQVPNSANLRGYRQELLRHAVRLSFGEVRVRPQKGASSKTWRSCGSNSRRCSTWSQYIRRWCYPEPWSAMVVFAAPL